MPSEMELDAVISTHQCKCASILEVPTWTLLIHWWWRTQMTQGINASKLPSFQREMSLERDSQWRPLKRKFLRRDSSCVDRQEAHSTEFIRETTAIRTGCGMNCEGLARSICNPGWQDRTLKMHSTFRYLMYLYSLVSSNIELSFFPSLSPWCWWCW